MVRQRREGRICGSHRPVYATSDGKRKRPCSTVERRQPTANLLCCSQPDFHGVTSLLEEHCRKHGFEVLFLPKFHPELNFIEQCWGRAKWSYRQLPTSPREDDLESHWIRFRWISCVGKIVVLYSLPLCSPTCSSFSNRSIHFMDAYRKGLNG